MAWERSGVPGGRTRTSWLDRDVPTMWRLLENQQSDDHWRLVAGWRKASELTQIHLRRLEQYRANLNEAWPPDRNAAAAAYVSRLDFLIQNVRTTHEVAAANYSTLAATVGALASARQHLKPLYDEYLRTARAIKDHNDLAAFNAASEGATVIGPAPARTQDLERLNGRARAIMYELSHTLIEAEAAIRQPPTYQPTNHWDKGSTDVYGSGQKPYTVVGVSKSPLSPESGGAHSLSPAAASPTPSVSDRFPDSGPPAIATGPIVAADRYEPTRLRRMMDQTSTQRPTRSPLSPPFPDGVIGAAPGVVGSRGSRDQPRINPVGGVIEAHRLGGSSPYSPSTTQPFYGGMAGRPSEQRQNRVERGVRDTVWKIADGVPPIIEPKHNKIDHDPGPVIGPR